MGPVNILLWALGIVLITVGYLRAKRPWDRLQALRAQDENVARYERWRGGVRDSSPTGASVAMAMLRREARIWASLAVVGFVLVFVGFALK